VPEQADQGRRGPQDRTAEPAGRVVQAERRVSPRIFWGQACALWPAEAGGETVDVEVLEDQAGMVEQAVTASGSQAEEMVGQAQQAGLAGMAEAAETAAWAAKSSLPIRLTLQQVPGP